MTTPGRGFNSRYWLQFAVWSWLAHRIPVAQACPAPELCLSLTRAFLALRPLASRCLTSKLVPCWAVESYAKGYLLDMDRLLISVAAIVG